MKEPIEPYTPTTEDMMRYFVAPPYKVEPRSGGEDFVTYLCRLSRDTMHSEINSEQAARRWLASYRAQTLSDAVKWARSCSGESADAAADYIEEMAVTK